ncbi:helix-turn-helix transcriptional regulator [Enterobacter mori]|uniref:helix-turn-helix transcriptional regulator n=1 Tax=Enterobacter mori TaxID=539813 RepID=UPI003B844897
MSEVNEDIMFSKEVMAFIRLKSPNGFIKLWRSPSRGFPKPFKIGRNWAWNRDDVVTWLEKERRQANAQ